jgi:hypothetical protein
LSESNCQRHRGFCHDRTFSAVVAGASPGFDDSRTPIDRLHVGAIHSQYYSRYDPHERAFYIYAITGYQLFHEHDPTHWRSLGISLLTLFRVVTLEDWNDVMDSAMDFHHLSWLYFVSFVILGTFVVIN